MGVKLMYVFKIKKVMKMTSETLTEYVAVQIEL